MTSSMITSAAGRGPLDGPPPARHGFRDSVRHKPDVITQVTQSQTDFEIFSRPHIQAALSQEDIAPVHRASAGQARNGSGGVEHGDRRPAHREPGRARGGVQVGRPGHRGLAPLCGPGFMHCRSCTMPKRRPKGVKQATPSKRKGAQECRSMPELQRAREKAGCRERLAPAGRCAP